MKASKILIFMLVVLTVLSVGWYVSPAGEVRIAGIALRFPSYERTLAEMGDVQVDVDEVLDELDRSFEIADTVKSAMQTYEEFIMNNPNRIYLPDDDFTFFDGVFALFEQARAKGRTCRIVHYGDSQIESDRLSGVLRSRLQELFGGSGTGMFPIYMRFPSPLFTEDIAGEFTHYAIVGDSMTNHIRHGRYGLMTQFSHLSGTGTVTVRSKRSFGRVSLLIGDNSEGFRASVSCDSTSLDKTLERDSVGVRYVQWTLPHTATSMTLHLDGTADIYGVALDGRSGVTVDNVSLRGCSGMIFNRLNPENMSRALQLTDTQIIILQFGGNVMPSLYTVEQIPDLAARIGEQIDWFHACAPQAKIIFIGPADMGRKCDGRVVTWPLLPEWIAALRETALSHDAAFWDMYSVMGGENSMAQWVNHTPRYASPDYIHFTPQGAEFMGNALAKSILTYYDFYVFRKTLSLDELDHLLSEEAERHVEPLQDNLP